MTDIVFIHGMFQNPKSWDNWVAYFQSKGYNCTAPAWPLHEGEPGDLRAHPSPHLGQLQLGDVLDSVRARLGGGDKPIMVGHSVGGLITQVMLSEGRIAAGVAINSVAPNAMIDLDWGFIKNSAMIANPLKGDDPVLMDAKTFHADFANTLSEDDAAREFEKTATHDSRNVLRGCLGPHGHIETDAPHGPLLLIGGEDDQIIPAHLSEKNFNAYTDAASVTEFAVFARSHYIVNEPGWQQVADRVLAFIEQHRGSVVARAVDMA